jgi:16S rRNA G527 N7-methylase RsmG
MWNTDNTNIEVDIYPDRGGNERLKQYTTWLKERNIKYNLVRVPEWASHPSHINMRNEDALIFKLTFGL